MILFQHYVKLRHASDIPQLQEIFLAAHPRYCLRKFHLSLRCHISVNNSNTCHRTNLAITFWLRSRMKRGKQSVYSAGPGTCCLSFGTVWTIPCLNKRRFSRIWKTGVAFYTGETRST